MDIYAIEIQSLESGLENLDQLPEKEDRGRHARQDVEGVERPQRHNVVHLLGGEAVVGVVDRVPTEGGVEHGERRDGEGEEGEEEDVDEEEGPDEAVLDLQQG